MNRFIRWYNQNRQLFFTIVIIIAFALITIHTLNSILEKKQEQRKNDIVGGNSSTNTSTTISKTDESVITGEKVSEYDDQTNVNLIKQFIEYCNDGEVEKAYNMLSNECKEQIYPSLEHFKTNYYKKIFYINRMYNIENWYGMQNSYTYYIKYTEDVLATGNVNSSNNKSDYITVVRDNDQYYLNINSYVGRQKKNINQSNRNVYIRINYIDMYMDYTIVNIDVENKTNNTICLDTKENVNTTYLYDTNNVKYKSFLNEIAEEQLVVRRNAKININIKFNKMYNPERELQGIAFSDIVLNYDNYINKTSKKEVIKVDSNI